MIRHSVSKNETGRTIERILLSNYRIDRNSFYKALRNKEIKINGKRTSTNITLIEGDVIEAYMYEKEKIQDKSCFLTQYQSSCKKLSQNYCQSHFRSQSDVYTELYQNEYVIIVNKKQGIPVQDDQNHEFTLIDAVRMSYGSECELCHRIDRNTGGIVIISKLHEYTDNIKEAINRHCYKKQYKCIVYGDARGIVGSRRAWHFKDSRNNRVYIYSEKRKYSKEIITEIYDVKYFSNTNTSEVSVNLITGRTHQIRAHMAFLGYPLIGDGKYGSESINKLYKYKYQALWACALIPAAKDEAFSSGLLPDKAIYAKPDYK